MLSSVNSSEEQTKQAESNSKGFSALSILPGLGSILYTGANLIGQILFRIQDCKDIFLNNSNGTNYLVDNSDCWKLQAESNAQIFSSFNNLPKDLTTGAGLLALGMTVYGLSQYSQFKKNSAVKTVNESSDLTSNQSERNGPRA